MKKLFALFLCLVLLTSCMDRPPNIDETEEETQPETVNRDEKPDLTYLEALKAIPGYRPFPDSIFCYTDPLLTEFVDADKIKFGKVEERYISWHEQFNLIIESEGFGTWDDIYPKGNFLTYPDGTKTKLCPVEYCREFESENCAEIDLSHGIVSGDWVYFAEDNPNMGWNLNPRRSSTTFGVNMLLRYSIKDHTVEKVLDLPDWTQELFEYRSVLYLRAGDYTYIIDGVNTRAAVSKERISGGAVGCGDYLYSWNNGEGLVRYNAGLTEREVVFADSESFRLLRGSVKDGLILQEIRNSGKASEKHRISLIDENGNETELLTEQPKSTWYVLENTLYQMPKGERLIFQSYDRFIDRTNDYYAYTTGIIYAYDIDGTSLGEQRIAYSEDMTPGEYLSTYFLQGKKIRVSTVLAPSNPNEIALLHHYILRDGEWILDGEDNFNT